MSNSSSALTRRRFPGLAGSVGGSAALYETMTALGIDQRARGLGLGRLKSLEVRERAKPC
jgi:hypothetical protein